jgi:zinc transport system substrate-binding protein
MRLSFHKATGLPAAAAFTALALLAVTACRGNDSRVPVESPEKLRVVTTIYPVTYFTQRVGGDRVLVTSLVPSGVEAHDFEPKPSDLRAIQEAKVVVYTHPAFEAWMADALKSAGPKLAVVQAAELHAKDNGGGDGHSHSGIDPHVWLNPTDAVEMVDRIMEGLIQADTAGEAIYKENAATLVQQLDELKAAIASGLESCRLKAVVVSHEAYGHLLEGYGIEQIGLAGLEAELAETGPRRLTEISSRMKAEGIRHILVEPILSQKLAEQIAAETGAALLPLHPMESLTSTEIMAGDDYFKIMDRNLKTLKTALSCTG